jgi:hypothetical protein
VVAREVTEIEVANRSAAELAHEVIIPASSSAWRDSSPAEAVVVDPTTLGNRHRRSSHHRVYRWTQACSLLAFVAGGVSVFCTMADDIAVARAVAGPGVVLGVVATILSGRTSLSERWRGWAIAGAVFAAAALLLTWVQPALTGEDHGDHRKAPVTATPPPVPGARQP